MSGLPIRWRAAEPPLLPCAVAAWGHAAALLMDRLLQRPQLTGLQGVVSDVGVVVLGAATELPWVDGVVYFGRHPEAPGVLLPTALLPDLPIELFARLVRSHTPDVPALVAPMEAGQLQIWSVAAARPLARPELKAARAALGVTR